jgi:hypothetical protein
MAHSASHWLLGVGVMRNAKFICHMTQMKRRKEKGGGPPQEGEALLSTRFLLVLFYFILVFIGLSFLSLKYFLVVGWLAALAG